jgi:tetratricopeptide (TPR) repeat protein
MLIIILVVIILIALGVIAWIVVPKLPQLSSIEPQETIQDKLKSLKKDIIIERLGRRVKKVKDKVITQQLKDRVQNKLSSSYHKLKELEDKYKTGTIEERVKLFLKRGQDSSVDDPEYAEKCFLDVINIDKRNLTAYEGLFGVYLRRRSLDEAVEVIDFLSRLNPASYGRYMFDFAEVLLESGDKKKARQYAEAALKEESSNPRYLDFLAELAILDGNKKKAKDYVDQLKGVNPENGKIKDFQARLKNMPT